jgi:ComF family protein
MACLPYSDLAAVKVVTAYQAIGKDLVWLLKFQGAQAAAREIAKRMAPFVPRGQKYVIVPIPTATSRVRQRGYDQANLIARELARITGVAYSPVLRRSGQFHQRGSNRDQRTSQLQGAYRVAKPFDVLDRQVILIDDVLTTGSTLEAAANVIKAAGAKRISGLVFARA